MTATGSRPPLVTVLVPTHDHALTVGAALDSVLGQTVADLDVVVIGDGASADVVDALQPYARETRVRTVLRAKSPSRAEEVRHEVLSACRSTFVAYCGDDDLMLPDHLEYMIDLLADVDFAHPLPMAVTPDGALLWHPSDLARPECRRWHEHPHRNAVSLTGVVHRLEAYRRLPHGWRTAPPGSWSDHYMWQQWFATPGLRYRTGTRLTVLKFDASRRAGMPAEQRRAELLDWRRRSLQPGFADELARLSVEAMRDFGIRSQLRTDQLDDALAATSIQAARVPELERALAAARDDVREREREVAGLRADLALSRRERDTAWRERDTARRERDRMRATRTWRARERVRTLPPVRALRRARRALRR